MRRQKQEQHTHPWRTQCSYRHHGTDKRRINMILGSIMTWQILSSHYQHISQLLQQSVKKRVSEKKVRVKWGNLIMNKKRFEDGKDLLNAVVRYTWKEWGSMADWLTNWHPHWYTNTLTDWYTNTHTDWLTEWLSNYRMFVWLTD